MTITVKVKDQNVRKALKQFGDDAPVGIAKTLNVLAFSSRNRLQETLDRHFTLRNKHAESGMWANAAHRYYLHASVGTTREYLADHVFGKRRLATNSRWSVAQVGEGKPRPTFPSKVSKARYPSRLLSKEETKPAAKRRHFIKPLRSGASGVWRKKGRIRKGRIDPSAGVELLYVLAKRVTVKADWPMAAIVSRQIDKRFETALQDGIVLIQKQIWSRNNRAR